MTSPTMSRVWHARILRARRSIRSAAVAVTCTSALVGGATGVEVFLAPDRPDVAGIAQRVGNQADQVGAFASDFVVSWLTATTARRESLRRFLTVPDDRLELPTTPAAVVTAPQVVSVIRTGASASVDVYAATVSLTERPYASADPVRAFYRVPVGVWEYQPRALTLPARVNGPGSGADVALAQRLPLDPRSPVHAVASGFVRAYLTTGGQLDRYVVAGAPLRPVGGYQSATVASASTDRAVPDDAASNAEVHVLVTVLAQTSQFATVTMSYSLRVVNRDGTWMVADLDLTPPVDDDAEATPVASTSPLLRGGTP